MNGDIISIINDWNPIEIYPLLKEEYQYEIERIQNGIRGNPESIEHLTDLIYCVFKDSFGDQFAKTKTDCKCIAETLI